MNQVTKTGEPVAKELRHQGEQAIQHQQQKAQQAGDTAKGKLREVEQRAHEVAEQVERTASALRKGLVVPPTHVEEEKLGPVADELKEQAKKTGQEKVERGQHVAQEASHAAARAAKEQGRQQGEELADDAKQRAQRVTSRIGS